MNRSSERRPPSARIPPSARLPRVAVHYIDSHSVGHLATSDLNGAPHVVPICYARIGRRIYFIADDKPKRRGPRRLKRLDNLAVNPQAALVIDDYDDDWRKLSYLLVRLTTAPVTDRSEFAAALRALRRRYPPYRSMDLAFETHPLIRMEITRWHLWSATGIPGRRKILH